MTDLAAVAMISGGFAFLAGAGTHLIELARGRSRQRYEHRARLDDIRRDLYSRYVALAQRAQWIGDNRTLAELAEVETPIQIVGTEPVRKAAWGMFVILSELFLMKDHGSAEGPEALRLMHELQPAILKFCGAAAAELGTKTEGAT